MDNPTHRSIRHRSPVRVPLIPGLLAVLLAGALPGGDAAACRFWGFVGQTYPTDILADHLRDGSVDNLKDLGGIYRDGWSLAGYAPRESGLEWLGPVIRRGGPPANHSGEVEFDKAVAELIRLRPRMALGHVRLGTSGHWGIPNPHPFQHDGYLFAHNGTISVNLLTDLLEQNEPGYFGKEPTDYVNGYIDSEVYFRYLLQHVRLHAEKSFVRGLCEAVQTLSELSGAARLNFVLTDGDTLYALRCAPYDLEDPVRFYPNLPGPMGDPEPSSYWVVASQTVGSEPALWGTVPPKSLAVFVPGQAPLFLPIDPAMPPSPAQRFGGSIGAIQPNPMGLRMAIPLNAPSGGAEAEVQIWDAQGRRVWSRSPARVDAGRQEIVWDGRASSGARVASGSYFCRIRLGDRISEQSVTVAR